MAKALIIESDQTTAQLVEGLLRTAGHTVAVTHTAQEGLALYGCSGADLLFVGEQLPGDDGWLLMERIRARGDDTAVVILARNATVTEALVWLKHGVFDYLPCPISPDELVSLLRRFDEYYIVRTDLQDRVIRYRCHPDHPGFIASCQPALAVFEKLKQLARSESPVIIKGEIGSGKTCTAERLIDLGPRVDAPVYRVTCLHRPETCIEFFMGRVKCDEKDIMMQLTDGFASKGTLLIEDIQAMPARAAERLQNFIQKMKETSGGRKWPLRIVATQDTSPGAIYETCTAARRIIEQFDLLSLTLPPLRDCREDILPAVAFHLCEAGHLETPPPMAENLQCMLESYTWPGNFREVREAAECLLKHKAPGRIRTSDDLPPLILASMGTPAQKSLARQRLDKYPQQLLKDFLHREATKIAKFIKKGDAVASRPPAELQIDEDARDYWDDRK